jgi:predicted nucleotidyltransferase component of viral defense system
MNNILSNFNQIKSMASEMQVPVRRERAIVREYLQAKIIAALYGQSKANQLCFTGGTSLRLLRNIDRFSEDLDFDNLGLSAAEIDLMIAAVVALIARENIGVELHTNHRGEKNFYELRFPRLLFDLGISTNEKEKLMIKIDYSTFWKGHKPETVLFAKYGFVERVVTNPLNQLVLQKLEAYRGRRQTQPRDMYDVVWLYAQGAQLDKRFMEANHLDGLMDQVKEKSARERVSATLKARLQPFLFEPQHIRKLDLFGEVLKELAENRPVSD